MRILVIHQHYLMPGAPGGSRFNEFAQFWSDAGHHIDVVACAADYNSGYITKTNKYRLYTREQNGSVNVYRCYVPPVYGQGYVGRAVGFAGFAISASLVARILPRPDVIVASSPPLTVATSGWFAARARLKTVPWIFEVRDLWPESAVTTGVISETGLLTKTLYGLEALAYKYATCVNVLTPAFEEDIKRRRLAASSKITFVPNGADLRMFSPQPKDQQLRQQLGWGDKHVFLYAGAHGRANALGQLVDTAEQLRHRNDLLIACVGDGPERTALSQRVRKAKLNNIVFHGPVSKSEMPKVVASADAGLAVLANNPTFRTVYPNKVFDYMACERPTVLAIDGAARKLVCDDAQAGVFAKPENAEDLARVIGELADSPSKQKKLGEQGRSWVEQHASREMLAKRYLNIMQKIVKG